MKYIWLLGSLLALVYSIYLMAHGKSDSAWWMAVCALWYAFYVSSRVDEIKK